MNIICYHYVSMTKKLGTVTLIYFVLTTLYQVHVIFYTRAAGYGI